MYRSGVHPAVQVCVRREGEIVLDRAIGHARGNGPDDSKDTPKVAATPDTPMTVYSAAKGVTAFVAHKLVEKGLFAARRPGRQVHPGLREEQQGLDHDRPRALATAPGCPTCPREALTPRIRQRPRVPRPACFATRSRLARQENSSPTTPSPAGSSSARSSIKSRARSIRDVLAEEFLDPLGFRWTNYGVAPEDTDEVALNYLTGPTTLPPLSTLLQRALGAPLDELVETTNDDRFVTGVVPAGNLVTTAHELSRFFEVMRCGGELDGVRVIETNTIRKALEEQSHLEIDFSLGFPTRFSYGLMLGAQILSLYGRDTQHAFGHLGFTNILGWADPQRAISAAVLTNGKPILYPELPRFLMLSQRITSEAPKVSESEMLL